MCRVCVRHVRGRLVSVQVGGLPLYLACDNVARRAPPSAPRGAAIFSRRLPARGLRFAGPPRLDVRSGRVPAWGVRGPIALAPLSPSPSPPLRSGVASSPPRSIGGMWRGLLGYEGNDPGVGVRARLVAAPRPLPRPVFARYARPRSGRVAVRLSPRREARTRWRAVSVAPGRPLRSAYGPARVRRPAREDIKANPPALPLGGQGDFALPSSFGLYNYFGPFSRLLSAMYS